MTMNSFRATGEAIGGAVEQGQRATVDRAALCPIFEITKPLKFC